MKRLTHDQFVDRIKNKNPTIKITGTYEGSKKRIKVQCMTCGNKWSPIAGSLLAGHGCPECGKKIISKKLAD